jgi:hypothetical protein
MSEMIQTDKQHEIMTLVLKSAEEGAFLDIDGLKDRLSYGSSVTKQALQCSIRFLEGHGVLVRDYETRRGRRRMVLRPTPAGYTAYRLAVSLFHHAEP